MELFYGSTRPHFFFFFFFFEKLKYFSYFSSDFQTVFTIVYRMIRRLHEKTNISEKKSISRPAGWFYFTSPGPQETLFYLRVALFTKESTEAAERTPFPAPTLYFQALQRSNDLFLVLIYYFPLYFSCFPMLTVVLYIP